MSQQKSFSLLKWLLILPLIAAGIGTASAGFLYSLNFVTDVREANRWIIAFLPFAGLTIGLLYFYYGKNIERGNNLLFHAIHDPQQIIPFRMAPFIYIGTIVTHLFGGSAGREGTALQMAGAIAYKLSQPFRLSAADKSIVLIASVAAGFGSVFGTPLAGAVFALEVIFIGRVKYTAIIPALVTSLLADGVTRLWNTPHTHYVIGEIPPFSFTLMLYAIAAGIVFGLTAGIFTWLQHGVTAVFKTINFPPFRPVAGGIIIALAVYFIGHTAYIGLGIPTIIQSFDEPQLLYVFAIKIAFTVVTLSAGFKGGEVTPLFFIGATLGSALAVFLPLPVGLLAGMGFVAVFAGATNTPLACSIMAMELFGYECAPYILIACGTAYLVSGTKSIYQYPLMGKSKYSRYKFSNEKKFSDL